MPERTDELKTFCKDLYVRTWEHEFLIERGNGGSPKAEQKARLMAQRRAADKVFYEAILKFSDEISEDDIWKEISLIHKLHVANLSDFGISEEAQDSVMERCISAHQSWIKTGGHCFERYISNTNNELLNEHEIKFILEAELSRMIKDNLLKNTEKDIEGLKSWGSDFDIYAIQYIHDEAHVFGCIQSKTSIRDRVGRDITFSQNAMDSLFWSIAVTLDGNFLNMPEFITMVNGGGSYPHNGWHGMYAMSGIEEGNDRIYKIDDRMELLVNHAVQAARQFIADRRLLNNEWKALDA